MKFKYGQREGGYLEPVVSPLGFEMGMGAMFRTPGEMAKQSVENDAHVIGRNAKDPEHATLLPKLVKGLKGLDREDIMVLAGNVIPAQDYAPCKTFSMASLIHFHWNSFKLKRAKNSGFGKSCTRNNNFLYE